jgi:RNA polymerase sigma factor (sigma-70 family)
VVQVPHWDASLEVEPDVSTTPVTQPDAAIIENPTGSTSDAALVERSLSGDRDAMAAIYDRHADRIYTMCMHMLGDPDEAADVSAQVFLVALQRLHQLRDPEKLRSWLYAITRHEIYRRSKDRSRVQPVAGVQDMAALVADPTDLEAPAPDATAETGAADPRQLAELVQSAAGGLEDRDRMVLELNVAQGLEGQELADALGVGLDNAYQMTHRMRERLERSAGALLVVSAGRSQCGDLEAVATKWDGTYDVLWRKRFARHVDRCDRCQRMRSRLPKAVLAGAALSQAAQAAVLAAPISIREHVLVALPDIVGTETAPAWSKDGFPRKQRPGRRLWQVATTLVFGVVLVGGLAAAVADGTRDVEVDRVLDASDPGEDELRATIPDPGSTTVPEPPIAPAGTPPAGTASIASRFPAMTPAMAPCHRIRLRRIGIPPRIRRMTNPRPPRRRSPGRPPKIRLPTRTRMRRPGRPNRPGRPGTHGVDPAIRRPSDRPSAFRRSAGGSRLSS